MGKNARKLKSARRRDLKRAAKAARKALYKSYGEQNRSSNKGRGKLKTAPSSGKGCHYVDNCGNPGCKRCHALLVGPAAPCLKPLSGAA